MVKKVKICGVSTESVIKTCVEKGADYIGFVFYSRSPRFVDLSLFVSLVDLVPDDISVVGVFVNPTDSELLEVINAGRLDYIQLHGEETTERVQEIKLLCNKPIIKAVSVRSGDDITHAKQYYSVADMLLFDARVPDSGGLPGGNGIKFDWILLQSQQFSLPWILSGGLTAENVQEAIRITGAETVDVSSSVEDSPGRKSPELVVDFLSNVKN